MTTRPAAAMVRGMWKYYPDLIAVPVPRYTSFPTAAEFHGCVGADEFVRALGGETGEVSLYVHIPFCEKICWYCGCNTSAANRKDRVATYLDALHREITLVAERPPNASKVARIAFGGGSPNGISPIDFVRLVDALALQFGASRPVISIELDPRALPYARSIAARFDPYRRDSLRRFSSAV